MIASRLGLLVLPVALACVCWLGCLALNSLPVGEPPDPCLEEVGAVMATYAPRTDELASRLRKAPPGGPEARAIEEEIRLLRRQVLDEVREVYRRHGRERPSRFPEKLEDRIGRLPEAQRLTAADSERTARATSFA